MNRVCRRWVLAALGLALLVPPACLSPTLPLPPPGRPDTIEPYPDGTVRLVGTVPPQGVAYAHNRDTPSGSWMKTGADGRYDFLIRAEVGNQILFWYNLSGEDSPTIQFEIPALPP